MDLRTAEDTKRDSTSRVQGYGWSPLDAAACQSQPVRRCRDDRLYRKSLTRAPKPEPEEFVTPHMGTSLTQRPHLLVWSGGVLLLAGRLSLAAPLPEGSTTRPSY